MSQKSSIEWTDVTWNPVTGCSKVSAGCKNCYAESIANRFWKNRDFTDVEIHPERLDQPTRWRKSQRIFVNSMSDLFHQKVPFEFIDDVFKTIIKSYKHTFQILTKRPQRMKEFFNWENKQCDFPVLGNVWLGVSVEDQATADERIPILLEIPARIRFISAEPLLEHIQILDYLQGWTTEHDPGVYSHDENGQCLNSCPIQAPCQKLDWVIIGGESGQNARPFNPDWGRSLKQQCKESGVQFFMKQIDKKTPIPNDLMLREFPICSK